MKVDLMPIFLAAVLIVMGIIALIMSTIPATEAKVSHVNCYDRNGNQIIGQTCLETIQKQDPLAWMIIGIISNLDGLFILIRGVIL